MNIFVLNNNPIKAAQAHCDKHVVKQILESAQLLCSAFWEQGFEAPYKNTHKNHPCSIWTRASRKNFEWVLLLAKELCAEYTRRYGKIHKTQEIISWVENNQYKLSFPQENLTEFAIAISPDKNCRKIHGFDDFSAVDKYRQYYILDKPFVSWKNREAPEWFTK